MLAGWGTWGHENIDRLAINSLPDKRLRSFFERNSDSIVAHALDPDKLRNKIKEEGVHHFIDADYYGAAPFNTIPEKWDDAVAKYSKDTLLKYGVNPWYIKLMTERLTTAFKTRNNDSIILLSSWLAHYVADAHVPLHTTKNYDGQLTAQKGIHALWESRIPELYGSTFNLDAGKSEYLKDPLKKAWKILEESYNCLDSVLVMERNTNNMIPPDKKYSSEEIASVQQQRQKKEYSEAYAGTYNQLMNNMVERRMRASIKDVGSFWYTAWVNAGKPKLK